MSLMKRSTILAVVTPAALVLCAGTATAENCRSACNQVRNVCKVSAKQVEKTVNTACKSEDRTCSEGCDRKDNVCKKSCKYTSKDCKKQAHDIRKADKAGCRADRDACHDVCDLADDRPCTDACAQEAKADQQAAKTTYKDCKKACPEDDTESTCRGLCTDDRESDDAEWADEFNECIDDCLPTTTSTMAPSTTLLTTTTTIP